MIFWLIILGSGYATIVGASFFWLYQPCIFDSGERRRRKELFNFILGSVARGEWRRDYLTYRHSSGVELTDESWPWGIQPYVRRDDGWRYKRKYFTVGQRRQLRKAFRAAVMEEVARSSAIMEHLMSTASADIVPESAQSIERELDIIRGRVPTPEGYQVNKARADG